MHHASLTAGIELDGNVYEWYVTFDGEAFSEDEEGDAGARRRREGEELIDAKVLEERFLENGRVYFERKGGVITYRGENIPGLSDTMSGDNIFENGGVIRKISAAVRNISNFHTLRESGIRYSKGSPPLKVQEPGYLGELLRRAKVTGHLERFGELADFFGAINDGKSKARYPFFI